MPIALILPVAQRPCRGKHLIYGGITGWRLPSANLNGTDCGQQDASFYNGSCDFGYNNTRSELDHLFFTDLGNEALYDSAGVRQLIGYGLLNTSFIDAASGQIVSFLNASNSIYWEREILPGYTPTMTWGFDAQGGTQHQFNTNSPGRGGYLGVAWAVHDGDIAGSFSSVVPVPAAAWLFGSGLMVLAATTRHKKK